MSNFGSFSAKFAGLQTPGPVNVAPMRLNDSGSSYRPRVLPDEDPMQHAIMDTSSVLARRRRLNPGLNLMKPQMGIPRPGMEIPMQRADPMQDIREQSEEIKKFVSTPKDKFSEMSQKAVKKLSKEKPKKKEIVGLLKSLEK